VLPEPKDFASDFHIFGLEWRPTGITFYVDGEQIGSLNPPGGAFWELGRFTGDNIWHNGTKMAPFDRRVTFLTVQ
jgi:beta-glucanase (GH16 family)